MSDEPRTTVFIAAKRILASETNLSLTQLVDKIATSENSSKNSIDTERSAVIRNILQKYIQEGYFIKKEDLIVASLDPVELLLERGFKQTHINEGTDHLRLLHFSSEKFPNVYFQIYDYGDGSWGLYTVAYKTAGENEEVKKIVRDLEKLPGYTPNKV